MRNWVSSFFELHAAVMGLVFIYVYYNRFVNPVAASFNISIEVTLMAIVARRRCQAGPTRDDPLARGSEGVELGGGLRVLQPRLRSARHPAC